MGKRMRNARIIRNVGRRRNVNRRGIITAIATGLVESNLKNHNGGDRDSVGVFQQRRNWGSRKSRRNVRKAAKRFYVGGSAKPDGYSEPGYKDLSRKLRRKKSARAIGRSAQAVQGSAYPGRYKNEVDRARAILRRINRQDAARKRRRARRNRPIPRS